MDDIRMKAPPGCKSISQGRNRALVGDDGHAIVPGHMVGDAISHGFVVSHLPKSDSFEPDSSASTNIQPQVREPLMKPAMPGDGHSAAFDLPALRKDVTAEKTAPKPRKAEGSGKRQK
jgi:hypothetical protein